MPEGPSVFERKINIAAAGATILGTAIAIWQWKGNEIEAWLHSAVPKTPPPPVMVDRPNSIASGVHSLRFVDAGRDMGLSDEEALSLVETSLNEIDFNEIDDLGCGHTCIPSETRHELVGKFGVLTPQRQFAVVLVSSVPNGSHCANCAGATKSHLNVFEIQRSESGWQIVRSALSAVAFVRQVGASGFLQDHLRLEPFGDAEYTLVIVGIEHLGHGPSRYVSLLAWNAEELNTVFSQTIGEVTESECPVHADGIPTDLQSTVELVEYPESRPEIVVLSHFIRAGAAFNTKAVFVSSGGQYKRVEFGRQPGDLGTAGGFSSIDCLTAMGDAYESTGVN